MLSAQGHRPNSQNISAQLQNRISVTADETRKQQNLFTSQEMQNMKLNHLRHKRKQLQEKLKMVSNRINFKKKKQEQQLKRFIRSQEKSIGLIQTHNYKKFNEMMKDQYNQKKNFQIRKKAKQVQDFRVTTNRRLSLIYQTVKDRKVQQSQKVRHLKKMDDQMVKYSREMDYVRKKQQHQLASKMKERQSAKKKCYWFEKKMNFQQKMFQQAQIYQKQIEDYYKKIQSLKESEQKLKEQQEQASQLLKCAQQNYQLLRQS